MNADTRKTGSLETAATAVGLLAGIVALIYLLGGIVISLRMLFDYFAVNTVVTIVGQLPREVVITTALLNVIGPAAVVGLIAALVYGALDGPKARAWPSDELDEGPHWKLFLVLFGVISIALAAPALHQAWKTDGLSPLLATSLLGILLTYGLTATGWYLLRLTGRTDWTRAIKALVGGVIWAGFALVPAAMLASALPFENAQVCTSASPVPETGRLIGEGGGRILLAQQFGTEASVVSLPAETVTKSEYGDLSSGFVCPSPPGQEVPAKVAAVALEGHGSPREVELATTLRPLLFFDTGERWRPIEAGRFIAERFVGGASHEACWKAPAGRCEAVSGLDQLRAGAKAPAYVDIHGRGRDGTEYRSPKRHCHGPRAVDCNSGPGAVIYYRRTSHEGRWYWDYWWLLRYNEYTGPLGQCNRVICSNHEGDWEGVTIVTTPSLQPEILAALYAAHRSRVRVEAAQMPTSGDHPLAFVARGTHAAYPFRCAADCKQYAKLAGRRLPEDPHDGAIAWGGNDDEECTRFGCVRALPEVGEPSDLALPLAGAWAGWRGLWGETCHRRCRSPLLQGSPRSPGVQLRFRCPWAATDRALPADDGSGLSRSEPIGDTKRVLNLCAAQRGGV